MGLERPAREGGCDMDFANHGKGRHADIIALFAASFTASEGAREGAAIADLVRDLLEMTQAGDLHVFLACEGQAIIGGAIFSRMRYAQDARHVVILSPMAVAPDRQGQGVGQALLRHALSELRADGVDVALTYGDPAFYGHVGYVPITLAMAAAPFALQQPEGWLGQSLTDAPLAPLKGAAQCVAALRNPDFW